MKYKSKILFLLGKIQKYLKTRKIKLIFLNKLIKKIKIDIFYFRKKKLLNNISSTKSRSKKREKLKQNTKILKKKIYFKK